MKFRSLATLSVISFSLSCVTPFALSSHAEGTSMPAQGRILHMEGQVSVRLPQETDWKTPKPGSWVPQGSAIQTGENSRCDIGLGEKRSSVLRLDSNSRTVLDTHDVEKIRVNLEAGKVWTRVRDLQEGSSFQVVTPSAIASARGTGWEQDMGEINVFENSVDVVGSSGEALSVDEGFGVDIDPSGDLTEPEALPEIDKAEWDSFEKEAEQAVAQEPELPVDPGFEPASSENNATSDQEAKATEETTPDAEATEPETADSQENDPMAETETDAFSEGFGTESGDFFDPAGSDSSLGGEDTLSEAKEEQQESESTDLEDIDDDSHIDPNCASQGGYISTC